MPNTKKIAYSIGSTFFLLPTTASEATVAEVATALASGDEHYTRRDGSVTITYIGSISPTGNSQWLIVEGSSTWLSTEADVQYYLNRYRLVPSPSMIPTGMARTLEYVPQTPDGLLARSNSQLLRRMAEAAARDPGEPAVSAYGECNECHNELECEDCGNCYDHCDC